MPNIVLAIGVDRYDNAIYNDLVQAVADANDFGGFLKYKLDFELVSMNSPTACAVEAKLEEILGVLDDDSKFVFFFAGRAVRYGRSENAFLLCRDAAPGIVRGTSTTGGIAPAVFADFARRAKGDCAFIYDACRTEPTQTKTTGGFGSVERFRDVSATRPTASGNRIGARWSLASCADGRSTTDDGAFEKALIAEMTVGLGSPSGLIFNDDFVSRLRKRLETATGRRPSSKGDPLRLSDGTGNASANPKPTGPVLKVPKPSADDADEEPVEVCEYEVGAIDVGVETLEIDEPTEPEQTESKETYLPPIPSEIPDLKARLKRLDAQIASLDRTISALRAGTHPSLDAAKGKIAAARTQVVELARKVGFDLPEFWRELQKNPSASPLDLIRFKPSGETLATFTRQIGFARSALLAKEAFVRTKAEYQRNLRAKVDELETTKRTYEEEHCRLYTRFARGIERFLDVVVLKVLETTSGFDSFQAPVPFEEFEKLSILREYGLGWDDEEKVWRRAAEIWKNRRPCIWIGNRAGERREIEIKGAKYGFRWAPPGSFLMGSPENEEERWDNETQHEVRLPKGFWVLETPVTQKLWKAVTGNAPSYFQGENLPVECVSWNDCQDFIEKLNDLSVVPNELKFRLPTEAEWEYACRAGMKAAYWWGNALNGDKANCDGNNPYGTTTQGKYLEKTSPVKSYDPNAWGLYDVHGNVWEWCSDWYDSNYYKSSPKEAPTGPTSAFSRVIRGGGWNSYAEYCRSARRSFDEPSYRDYDVGLRLVLSSSK